ncbi:MAG: ribosome maturation factor RimP [Dialister micraerophilus]|uniref:ribosome maturation factor RimP n=1 Tax=Dialister micraerophilus TaxID=309120 RepID=UPI0025515FCC|nr:ribosome maturation factor RimP [Dialister micraerophilus]MDK8252882.1 ribosome maturation factor RimP [Dialister micraerophilus]
MSHKEIESAVEALIQPVLEKKGIEVVDVEYVRERNWILRIFIDKDGGVDLNDCQEISVSAGELIDKNDLISDNYMLEVSSPGIDRVLKKDKDFIRYKDSKVSVKLFASVEELNLDKEFTAILNGLVNDEISLILDDGREIFLSKKKISQMRLYFEF